jgi:hypothetical protein
MSFLDLYNKLLKQNVSTYDQLPYLVSKKFYKKNTLLNMVTLSSMYISLTKVLLN